MKNIKKFEQYINKIYMIVCNRKLDDKLIMNIKNEYGGRFAWWDTSDTSQHKNIKYYTYDEANDIINELESMYKNTIFKKITKDELNIMLNTYKYNL
jgi:Mg/Co/Ni transporter MgtE